MSYKKKSIERSNLGTYTAIALPSDGQTIDASDVTTDFNGLINEFNGNIDNTNIKAGAGIAFSKLATDAWTAYTPTWTGGSPSIGNGTLTGSYIKIGRIVIGTLTLIAGSTTNFGTLEWAFTLPITASNNVSTLGSVHILDSGNTYFTGTAFWDATTTFKIYFNNVGGAARATTPMTWATNDTMRVQFTYESAS